MKGLQLVATGKGLPKRVVTNVEMEQYQDTNDEWIRSRTGIKQRYHSEEETHGKLCVAAARQAMDRAGITADQIGLCIVATLTADYQTPSAACVVSQELGFAPDCVCFDLGAACSGFIYALQVAHAMFPVLEANGPTRPYALLIGAEQLSRVLDVTDRGTGILFGDGAGAALVKASETHHFYCKLGSQGNVSALWVPGAKREDPVIHMDGHAIFRFAVKTMADGIAELEEATGISAEDIDYIVCHQANERIIDHVIKRRKLPEEKFYKNVARYGNTSGASIPLALSDMEDEGLLKKGSRIFLVGFGAGLTWGSAYLEI